jgi:aminoglycoside/choline kinase family phosphotransferase
MEDLGDRDLWSYRMASWPERRPLYESALNAVAKLHRLPESVANRIRAHLAPVFNEALYRWEQNYFFEHCLGRHFDVDGKTLRELSAVPALRKIARQLASYSRVLVHRDFQSQNLIIRDGEAYLIDFQGMRPGLAEYDLASLLYDPYVSLTNKERDELLGFYRTQKDCHDSAQEEKLRLCAMQRLMQALGAYGYLGHVKGNSAFLTHIPAALYSLGEVIAEIDGLELLRAHLRNLPIRS